VVSCQLLAPRVRAVKKVCVRCVEEDGFSVGFQGRTLEGTVHQRMRAGLGMFDDVMGGSFFGERPPIVTLDGCRSSQIRSLKGFVSSGPSH